MKIYQNISFRVFSFSKNLFTALKVKNYRVFFTGQSISLIGTWVQRTTMGWFVYRVTGSAFLLGLIGFLSQIPSVFISPFAGVWADHWNRHLILKITQISALFQALFLALMVLTNNINIWLIIILSLLHGIIEAVDAPARQSFVIDLVGKRHLLPNAIALNSAMFNGARLIGPAVAGILIATFNEGICFGLNAISYIAVIISLYMITVPIRERRDAEQSMFSHIKKGWKYAFSHLPIRYLIGNISFFTFFGMSYAVLIPIFAKDVLRGNSQTLGYLMSAAGIGAFTGAMYLAGRKSIQGLNQKMIIGAISVSLALIVFSISKTFILSMSLMLFIGFGLMMQMASSNTIIQSIVADDMRGRVMSLHSMAFMSIAPFGSLMVGSLSSKLGAPFSLALCGFFCLIWSVYGLALMPKLVTNINSLLISKEVEDIILPESRDVAANPGR